MIDAALLLAQRLPQKTQDVLSVRARVHRESLRVIGVGKVPQRRLRSAAACACKLSDRLRNGGIVSSLAPLEVPGSFLLELRPLVAGSVDGDVDPDPIPPR